MIQESAIITFREKIWNYYSENGRKHLPWREAATPYRVMISEIMLQQTQVERVIPLFEKFVAELPDFTALASVSQPKLLSLWQGLGYNRRALFLKRAAEKVIADFGGELPRDRKLLQSLPGIGEATSGAIMVYAFGAPETYIETNIRAVFIHEFFADRTDVEDSELLPLIERSLEKERVFEWYSAIMDYGTMLKKQIKNPSRKSKHHSVQSKFEGSDRQIRGAVIRELLQQESLTLRKMKSLITEDKERLVKILKKLESESFCVREKGGLYRIEQ